jgi:acetyl-CoA C-acetyltransferase
LVVDGLWDVYNKFAMGNCSDHTARKHEITREQQDDHCLSSYTRAEDSWKNGLFEEEIAPVTVKGRKGDTIVKEDEDYKKLLKDKYRSLKPVFDKSGTATPANSSSLNDGASAVVLASGDIVEKEGLKPLAKILGEFRL